jgi:ankyrin repeat protein
MNGSMEAARLLLEAAPAAATCEDMYAKLPVQSAAGDGHAAMVKLLLPASLPFVQPGSVLVDAIAGGHADVAQCLLEGLLEAEGNATQALHSLVHAYNLLSGNRPLVLSLFNAAISRMPLTQHDWQLLPSPCSGLAAALPAVLQRSDAEAARLVAHLPDAERARLRLLTLCLSRASQRRLPAAVSRTILAACALTF